MTSDADRVSRACEVRLQQGEDSVRNSKAATETRKDNVVISVIESCAEVKGNDSGIDLPESEEWRILFMMWVREVLFEWWRRYTD